MSRKTESTKQRNNRVRGKQINKNAMFWKAFDNHIFRQRLKDRIQAIQGEKENDHI